MRVKLCKEVDLRIESFVFFFLYFWGKSLLKNIIVNIIDDILHSYSNNCICEKLILEAEYLKELTNSFKNRDGNFNGWIKLSIKHESSLLTNLRSF